MTPFPRKQQTLTSWCSGAKCVSNTLSISASAALCSDANLAPSVPSINPHYQFRTPSEDSTQATFLKHCSSTSGVEKCVCMCICVRLHLCMCETVRSRGTPCLFYYSYSCVDPLSAHRHLPEIHTAHTDVLAIFSLQALSLSGAHSLDNKRKNTPQQTTLCLFWIRYSCKIPKLCI